MGVTLSQEEVRRQRVLQQVVQRRVSIEAAAVELQVSVRTIWRLKQRFEHDPASICHGLRGKRGNRQVKDSEVAALEEMLAAPRYWDCGPTFLRDELKKRGQSLCKESIRKEFISRGLWIVAAR